MRSQFQTEEVSSEVDSLHALLSSRLNGLEAGIEHLVPKPQLHQSTLSMQQTEEMLSKVTHTPPTSHSTRPHSNATHTGLTPRGEDLVRSKR